MTERNFRLVVGAWLMAALLLNQPYAVYALMGIMLFEAVTNWRVPIVISRLRYGRDQAPQAPGDECLIPFEAERALRLIVVAFLVVATFGFPDLLWWMPWLVGFALIGAGLSGICPMVLALRWVGMR